MSKGTSKSIYGRRPSRTSSAVTTQSLTIGDRPVTEKITQAEAIKILNQTTSRSKFGNKKILEADGTRSDSKLESYLKRRLDMLNISYHQQVSHVLMPSFRYKGELIRQIAYKLDFVVDGRYAVETKGFFTADGKIKWKLFLHQYGDRFEGCLILRNQKQCDEFVSRYLLK
ncbi:DUF1064 domain-containing protein [bacterium]|nr:DUF1064 domain-containing protein [bacterium]